MSREFYTWPHTARKIVEESLREFVGDGEGEDYEVLTALINEVQAEALRDAADWLLRIGYVTDITFDIAAPAALWEAFVDAAHRDADGTVHGNALTRAEVDDWLSVESGRLDPKEAPDGR